MKLLVHSNAPWVSTGYGVQCRYLIERLAAAGHEVAVSSTYGHQGGVRTFGEPPIARIYPSGYEVNGNDVIHNHALHFFDGDPLGGWIIPLLDVWCLVNPRLAEFNIAAWCPVDHFPVPAEVRKFFERNPEAVPVAMSRYGERQLREVGLDPVYVPLAVDTTVYKPSPTVTIEGQTITGRQLLAMGDGPNDPIPDDAFVVGMVAMNKGWARDRKGFNEALRAFGLFWKEHQNAVLYMHCDWPGGAEGIQLKELATHASVPPHAIRWVDQYAYRMGFSPQMMAATYSAFDVLLAPSHGEGFCVPLIEAQACGTPVITSDFSTGPELCGAGWLVAGQLEWDPAQHASYICPYTVDVVRALNDAYNADRTALAPKAVEFAAQYDADRVFIDHWLPFLAELEQPNEPPPLTREPMDRIDVIVPAVRATNRDRLVRSFDATNDGSASLICVEEGTPTRTFAENVNAGLEQSTADWVLLTGDDVEFKPGWLAAARRLSDRFDVIGTNDSTDGKGNPRVQNGTHADHFFVRRSYIDKYGACLDGPGKLAPECYRHFYTDVEIIELAKARSVFTPCLDSVIEHHHPDFGKAAWDDVYQSFDSPEAVADGETFQNRAPLIAMQRSGRGRR